MSDLARYRLEGTTAVIELDDGKANALSMPMLDAIDAALTRAEGEASAVVLAGRAGRFSAGFDLKVMMSGPDNAIALLTRGAEVLMRCYGTPLPLVIACTGHALAAGALLLLTGDHRIVAEGEFKLGLNEVAIGLAVPVLAMELARDRLSPAALTRATLFAHVHSPAEALTAGYVDEVAPAEALMARALVEAARLGALGRTPYRATKERLRGRTIAHIRATLADDMRALMGGG